MALHHDQSAQRNRSNRDRFIERYAIRKSCRIPQENAEDSLKMNGERDRTPSRDGEVNDSVENEPPAIPKKATTQQPTRNPPPRAAKTEAKTVFDLDRIPRKSPTAEVRKERERRAAQKKAASARLDQERAHRVTERQSRRRAPTPVTAGSAKPPSKTAQRYAASQAKKAAAVKKAPAPAKTLAGPPKVTKKAKPAGPTAKELDRAPKHVAAIRALIWTLEKDNEGGYDDALVALHRAAEVLPVPEVPSSPETPPRRPGRRVARARPARVVKEDDDEDEE